MMGTDTSILLFIQEHFHNRITDFFFPVVSALGNAGMLWIAVAVLLLFHKKDYRWGILLGVTLLLTFLCNDLVLKPLVARPRPFVLYPQVPLLITPPASFSFPSGHTASSFAAAFILLFFHRKLGISALVLAALIAFSRLFLFVHFPSDVLAGAILGTGIAWITHCAAKRFSLFPKS